MRAQASNSETKNDCTVATHTHRLSSHILLSPCVSWACLSVTPQHARFVCSRGGPASSFCSSPSFARSYCLAQRVDKAHILPVCACVCECERSQTLYVQNERPSVRLSGNRGGCLSRRTVYRARSGKQNYVCPSPIDRALSRVEQPERKREKKRNPKTEHTGPHAGGTGPASCAAVGRRARKAARAVQFLHNTGREPVSDARRGTLRDPRPAAGPHDRRGPA